MKKSFALFLFVPLLLGCNKSAINIPKSPFNDSYNRIGMKSNYTGNIETLNSSEYESLKTGINNYEGDTKVKSYIANSEVRDLKYAYFGSENSSLTKCTMDSRKTESKRFENLRTFIFDTTNTQKQTDSGIIATNSITNSYTFSPEAKRYKTNIKKKYNNEKEEITVGESKTYEEEESELRFGLTPYKNILSQYFSETEKYKFKVLGDNAVYGKINIDGAMKYIVKEAYSLFDDYTTTSGRKFKSCDNYFYEALLDQKDNILVFTDFRFYKEKLILSEAIDDTGIPVLYLEKPVLVEYTETIYQMQYDSLGEDHSQIPGENNA